MLALIGFLAVITASVTASLVESSRRRFAAQSEVDVMRRLEEISERLATIEHTLNRPAPAEGVRARFDAVGHVLQDGP